ncbi:MAG: YncE family protein [Gemmatimonadaceae bacterium]
MHISFTGAARRGLVFAAAAACITAGFLACTDSTSIDPQRDRIPPTLTLTPVGNLADTVIGFTTEAKDNLGLKTVHVQAIGAVGLVYDTLFTTAVTDFQIPFTLFASRSVPPGTPVTITATAMDGAGNSSGVDTLILATGNVPPPIVKVLSPFSGSSAVLGKSIVVTVMGNSGIKVRSLGLTTTGPVVRADSVLYSSPLFDSLTMQDTVAIPANAAAGTLTITPFLRDSLGQRAVGPSITINVQTAAQINSVPVVNQYCVGNSAFDNACGHLVRVEVGDSMHVEADDPSGIGQLGYEVRSTPGGAIDDSATFISSGQLTFQPHTFAMKLPYTTFPTTAYVQVFARNTNGIRAYAKLASGADRVDTVTVVAGVTRPLPVSGGVSNGLVADAMYHPGKDRLYMTNINAGRVEVFDLATLSFLPGVNVGSRPWGIAGWPADPATGAMLDTLLVANSGGTSISYVSLDGGSGDTPFERSRYQLPNIIAFTITTTTSGTSGLPIQVATKYDFSDRPQYLAATCRPVGGACGDVILAYSTTPTPGQSVPFEFNNGTLRWEDLTNQTSHFFFEQAIGQSAARSDTLEVIRFDGNTGAATTLVPYTTGSPTSTVIDISRLGFRDTTFVRGSGNFQRAIFGEGGAVNGSRAMTYDVSKGSDPARPWIDLGVSPASDVSDFIANAFSKVQGVAINRDGSLVAIRGDSTYLLNGTLRLQGVLPTSAGDAGLDFHPSNDATMFPLLSRLIFAASSQPLIDVYDTFCYQKVATIQIRDPIIGPVKAALRPNGQLVLVGATARGVVIASLPNTFTTTCM